MRLLVLCSLLMFSTAAVQAEQQRLPLSHKSSGTLYVQTQLGSSEITGWLVDTGSDYSVIDKASVDRLLAAGQAHFLKNLRAKLADGSERIIPLYRVDKLQLAGHCELRNVKVAVLPKSSRRIMGLSALRQLAPFSVSFDPPMLTVSGCQPTAVPQQAALSAAPETKTPAQSAGEIVAKNNR